MSDELLPYYDRELAFIRDLGKEFTSAHPKIATRLGMGPDAIKDPHVDRMVKAFAYLNARIRYKLDDEFPELTDSLLEILYPHYLAPIPSMSIIQFEPTPDITNAHSIAVGTELETDPVDGEPCRFRTCYPVTLWPIQLKSARLSGHPLPAPKIPHSETAQSVLQLNLACMLPDVMLSELNPSHLRFFLRGQEQHVFPLYDLLLNDPIQVAVATGPEDPQPILLSSAALQAVGFAPEEGLLPYPRRSFLGYRLLTEFFTFPHKFLFFDLRFDQEYPQDSNYSGRPVLTEVGQELNIYIYIKHKSPDLERTVTAENFALGCTPVINLFSQRAEPISVGYNQYEYEIVPDRRRRKSMEVYSVDEVSASNSDGESVDYYPFYGAHHAPKVTEARRYWHARRRSAKHFEGSEIFITLVDLDFEPAHSPDYKLSVTTTCLNRNLPNRLPFGGGQPRLQIRDGAGPIETINCLTSPTPTARSPLAQRARWRLISNLSLNHLSIVDQQEGVQALQEILRLYDFRDSEENQAMIAGIEKVIHRAVAARLVESDFDSICRGTEVTIQFEEARFVSKSIFLFASVLERFLALYSSINSFTRLTVTVQGGEKTLHRWPARAGEQIIL